MTEDNREYRFLPEQPDCGSFQVEAAPSPAEGWVAVDAIWAGELRAVDYVHAAAVANSLNEARPWPTVRITGAAGGDMGEAVRESGPLEARARVVHPQPRTEDQAKAIVANALAAGVHLATGMGSHFTDYDIPAAHDTQAPPAEATQDQGITRERVAAWFEAQGVEEIPFDEELQLLQLSFDGTAVDIDVSDPGKLDVRIGAIVPGTSPVDPGTLVHLANRANAVPGLATAAVTERDGSWWVVSQVAVPAGGGLDDEQLAQAIHDAVLGAATQLRAVMHRVNQAG